MRRQLLWGSLLLAPATIAVDRLTGAGDVALFVLAAAALIPLAWLIGEATEHAAEHTGPGIGGFLNASFGNAPELIVALFAVGANLPVVVRGSLSGSVDLEPPARLRDHADGGPGRSADRPPLAARADRSRRRRGRRACRFRPRSATPGRPSATPSWSRRSRSRSSSCSSTSPSSAATCVATASTTRPRGAERGHVDAVRRARRPRRGDRRHRLGERDPRPFARRVREGCGPERVLHRRR